ncbi:MAG: 2,4'-dihydroxyacetophenone dioxygenase family protein [Rhizobiaceae bacterium]|nr:2,4'-dihydroxyacetophenone dioxygenase family protein [Rhizobiaceae bacterium]
MAEQATTEFWKDIKPIENVFKPDAGMDVYVSNAAYADDKYFMQLSETGVYSRPLWINPSANKWCDILMAKNAGLVNRHYHPHEVFAYTISGKWGYLEHDWTATAGDFIYESPGEGHTLVAYEHEEPMRVMFIVTGPIIWLDEDGNSDGHLDVFDYIKIAREHYANTDLGAEYVDTLMR